MEEKKISLRYQVKAQEVFDALTDMDKLQGKGKKSRIITAALMGLAVLDLFYFFSSKNGFALILALVVLVLVFLMGRKSLVGNRKLADAFEKDPEQIVDVLEDSLQLTDRATSYEDIMVLYEFKDSFSMRYMENYYFVIPKRVFEGEEQMEEFRQLMKDKLGQRYSEKLGRI